MFDLDNWLYAENRSDFGAKQFQLPYNMGIVEAELLLLRLERFVPMNDLILINPSSESLL
ncbi:hypothetical protein TUMEXPCC7403_17000 [Tumidithrix helvetica PCC 7403]|uniref:hypothetical protein n=1 Tax=Tumidithrix helvetica TaxID=3457545 RepID=UPI003CC37036